MPDLARLHFSEEELDEFTVQFQGILDYVEQLETGGCDGIEPTSHVSLTADFEKHIFREDESRLRCLLKKAWQMLPIPAPDTFVSQSSVIRGMTWISETRMQYEMR